MLLSPLKMLKSSHLSQWRTPGDRDDRDDIEDTDDTNDTYDTDNTLLFHVILQIDHHQQNNTLATGVTSPI